MIQKGRDATSHINLNCTAYHGVFDDEKIIHVNETFRENLHNLFVRIKKKKSLNQII